MNVGEALNLLEGLPDLAFWDNDLWLNLETWEICSGDNLMRTPNIELGYINEEMKTAILAKDIQGIRNSNANYASIYSLDNFRKALKVFPVDTVFKSIHVFYVAYHIDSEIYPYIKCDTYGDESVNVATLDLATKQQIAATINQLEKLEVEMEALEKNLANLIGFELA